MALSRSRGRARSRGASREGRTASAGGPPFDRIGLVVARPLPYLYLAREVFDGADLPFEALDTLPLAAEPYAAAVDVVLECAAANFTRRALMALLRSPHFRFDSNGGELDRAAVSRLDQCLAAQRYLGGLDRLTALTGTLDGARAASRGRRAVDLERAGAAAGITALSRIRSICCASSSTGTIDDSSGRRPAPPRARAR